MEPNDSHDVPIRKVLHFIRNVGHLNLHIGITNIETYTIHCTYHPIMIFVTFPNGIIFCE
jgi:hypothetical protein